jgi:hypothetical protein
MSLTGVVLETKRKSSGCGAESRIIRRLKGFLVQAAS